MDTTPEVNTSPADRKRPPPEPNNNDRSHKLIHRTFTYADMPAPTTTGLATVVHHPPRYRPAPIDSMAWLEEYQADIARHRLQLVRQSLQPAPEPRPIPASVRFTGSLTKEPAQVNVCEAESTTNESTLYTTRAGRQMKRKSYVESKESVVKRNRVTEEDVMNLPLVYYEETSRRPKRTGRGNVSETVTTNGVPAECPICGKFFAHDAIEEHASSCNECNDPSTSSSIPSTPLSQLTCELCDAILPDAERYLDHIKKCIPAMESK